MKANYRKINTSIQEAFHIGKDGRTHFYDNWHFHDMHELVVILAGDGQRLLVIH